MPGPFVTILSYRPAMYGTRHRRSISSLTSGSESTVIFALSVSNQGPAAAGPCRIIQEHFTVHAPSCSQGTRRSRPRIATAATAAVAAGCGSLRYTRRGCSHYGVAGCATVGPPRCFPSPLCTHLRCPRRCYSLAPFSRHGRFRPGAQAISFPSALLAEDVSRLACHSFPTQHRLASWPTPWCLTSCSSRQQHD